ncbi:phage holin family protein [bacterium SCSIO 12643]|nr:phage holin family protein [bacterium SCSIO 12643]
MSFLKISESIKDAANKIIDLVNAHLDYYQIVAFDKLVFLLSKSISSAIAGFTVFMVIFFGSFALAEFLGELLAHISIGYLIVAVLYGIGGWILWRNRVQWILNPIIAALTEAVEETAHDLGLDSSDDEKNETSKPDAI